METAQIAAIHGALSLFLLPICLVYIEYWHDFLPSPSDFFKLPYTSEVNNFEFENSYHQMYNSIKKTQTYSLDAENQHSHIKKTLWTKVSVSAFHS